MHAYCIQRNNNEWVQVYHMVCGSNFVDWICTTYLFVLPGTKIKHYLRPLYVLDHSKYSSEEDILNYRTYDVVRIISRYRWSTPMSEEIGVKENIQRNIIKLISILVWH